MHLAPCTMPLSPHASSFTVCLPRHGGVEDDRQALIEEFKHKSRSTSLYNAGSSSRGGCRALQLYSAPERSTSLQLYSALHSTSSTPTLRILAAAFMPPRGRPTLVVLSKSLSCRFLLCRVAPLSLRRAATTTTPEREKNLNNPTQREERI